MGYRAVEEAPGVGIVIPVGPGDEEFARVSDVVDSILWNEPLARHIVLVDDNTGDSRERSFLNIHESDRMIVIDNPRSGRGDGYTGGMAVGVLAGIRWLWTRTTVDVVVKMDTDSLVIGPFYERVRTVFAENPNAGMLGSCRYTPRGEARRIDIVSEEKHWGKFKQRLVWRRQDIIRSLFGEYALVRKVLVRAVKNGYQLGEHCQGGGYALSRKLVDQIGSLGYLDAIMQWLFVPATEDRVVGAMVRSVDMELLDFNKRDEVFGVKFRGLPYTPDELLVRNFAIIHSVKGETRSDEARIREYFRKHRHTKGVQGGV